MEIESFYPVREIPVEAKIPVKIPTFLEGSFKDSILNAYRKIIGDLCDRRGISMYSTRNRETFYDNPDPPNVFELGL